MIEMTSVSERPVTEFGGTTGVLARSGSPSRRAGARTSCRRVGSRLGS